MVGLNGVRGPGPAGPAERTTRRRDASGFALPAESPAAPTALRPAATLGALDVMLSLQEVGGGEVADREARRHGRDLLEELAALQRALLAGDGSLTACLERLAQLTASLPLAGDPGLRAVLGAIALRARVELARREAASR